MYLQKLINIFYIKYLEKSTVIYLPLDFILPIARPTVLKEPKYKHDHLSKRANKKVEMNVLCLSL